ncbi:MAG: hypothetical protein MUP55_03300 [Candidatus Aenigmarchaeota archaeon]|nr:hypothetical protein [Candidatus Aenigmarchaeota archaeon]
MARSKNPEVPEQAQGKLFPDPKPLSVTMEFLMTYGWAILVVLAAIGALWYFGVLSPSNFFPKQSNESTSCCDLFCKQVSNGKMSCDTLSQIGMNGKIICKSPVGNTSASVLFTFNVPNKSEFCP